MIDLPDIRKGDQVKVFQKITEGKRDRVVSYSGRVTSIKGSGDNMMLTLHQVLDGIGVDRILPTSAPSLSKIEKIEEKKVLNASSRKKAAIKSAPRKSKSSK